MRAPLPILLLLALACRPYDDFAPVAGQGGLIPADQYARYGREQAQAVAIGRSLAHWKMPDRAAMAAEVEKYALTLPDVVAAEADPAGYRITVTFRSGWRASLVPIDDGVRPQDTPGLPAAVK